MRPTIASDDNVFDFKTLLHPGMSSNISRTWLPIPP